MLVFLGFFFSNLVIQISRAGGFLFVQIGTIKEIAQGELLVIQVEFLVGSGNLGKDFLLGDGSDGDFVLKRLGSREGVLSLDAYFGVFYFEHFTLTMIAQ